ncbi:Dynein heavy chain, domain-2,Dynein heavy chain domain,Dynein heavy chain, P-loop containing D4 domain,P- [Cinara cedri]|uniref:Dynein heavy chain, domain-2,Dynein heavy chain domain,Dynein heavy chain, P-loop containing D4 domain,P n=1 Tax=Cinara cedri TaxID=506608 RepID=A0A5E4NHL1_9HEMI|nr:Dynein heavy chain, domain-2,Dynein heavy chain domain,Dynein heavy chain, P-loop containing D4 domain,P- [Cinara cedri]
MASNERTGFYNERQIIQLLDTVPNVPKLPKIPDISKYLNRSKTINKSNAISDRRTIIKNYMNECAVTQKIDLMMAKKSIPVSRQEELKMPQINYHKQLRDFANAIEPTPMQESWIENIIDKSKIVRWKKTKMALSLIEEVKDEYIKVIKKLQVDGIVKPIPSSHGMLPEKSQEKPLKTALGGKTKHYPLFLKRKALLAKRLHTTHPTTINILYFTKRQVPKTMINVESYKFNEFSRDLDDLMATLEHDFRRQDTYLTKDWYKKVILILTKKGAIDSVTLNTLPQFLKGVTTIISLEMERMILKSIDHIVKVFGNITTIPKLNFTLHFVGSKCISTPSIDDICDQYCSVLNLLNTAASELPSLEYQFKIPVSSQFISIKRSKQYLDEAKLILAEKLNFLYKELTDYLIKLENDFYDVVYEKQFGNLTTFLQQYHTYDELLEKLDFFQSYRNKAIELVDGWNFELGNIDQVDMKNHICDLAKSYMDQIIEHIVIKQLSNDERVCYKFNEMVSRAISKPKNSEEFLALGDYMLYASTTFMTEMTQTVKDLTVVACNISQYAVLPREFWEVHASAIKWIQNISPVFVKYSIIYEAGKSNAEETLTKVISKLNYDLDAFAPNLTFLDHIDDVNKLYEYKLFVNTLQRKIEKFDDTVIWINREEELFNKPISTFPELDEIKVFTKPFVDLITFSYRWFLKKNIWLCGDFDSLSLHEIETTVDEFYKEATKVQSSLKFKCKEMLSQNYSKRYEGLIDDDDMNLWPAPLKIAHQTINSMDEFRQYMSIIRIMCNPALAERHWEEMSELMGFDLTPNAGTTLSKIIELHLEHLLPQFEVISISATKEEELRKSLQKMKEDWKTIQLSVSPYKDSNINILTGLDDIQALLDDHFIKTISIRGSAFVKPIENEVKEWFNTLNRMNMTLEEWERVQIQWLYLMPIFSSKDIVFQMPKEGIQFNEIDKVFRRLLSMVDSDSLALKCVSQKGILESLIKCTEMMETINLGVNNYLENKRLLFPRFFFLSNNEMLDILSESINPKRVQPHLKTCFEGIAKLEFNENLDILKFCSSEGETIDLNQNISTIEARGSVENWLIKVEEQMVISIRKLIENAYCEYPTEERKTWVQKWPGQCVLCVSQMFWTAEVHNVFMTKKPQGMRNYHHFLTNQLNNIVDIIRGKLNRQTRISLSALVTLDVHCRDVVNDLANNNISNEMDFKWLCQLRYYWKDNAFVHITKVTIKYSYEYLGNTPRLVITPLTDRCYRTLINAYYLHLNGAPEGPASTGKTETIKDLAKALATRCIVFNCSDSLDYLAMGKFFKGLASSGAWACFDEFNRISIEVLSVVAQQILSIVQAVRTNVDHFVLEGTELRLNPRCFICITMNPGYAGRYELPDNLKVLFRTVAMMVPDCTIIGEVSLYSYGFLNARELSVKIVTVYKLCSEQLSSQPHYDYGMRAIKTVLIAAGNLKKEFPEDDESQILRRSILNVNSAKLLNKDIPLFNGIISDLFPDVELSNPDHTNFICAAKIMCTEMCLQPIDAFIEKCIQTYEMMVVRHGFMLVGNPCGGKTSLLHLLAKTLNLLNKLDHREEMVEYETINPKALTLGQLYGCFDEVTHEWSNGVVANIFRQFAISETSNRKWLIFDGPIDAVWIENMNTVLDDSKKLCSSSGEVIDMPDYISMIFETMDLTQASPATVSRCGIIYLDPLNLGWRPLIETWIKTCPESWSLDQHGIDIMYLFDWIAPPCLHFVHQNCVELINAGEANTVLNVLNILKMQLKNASVDNPTFNEHFTNYLQGSFVYACIWGFGGTIDSSSRSAFDLYFKELWKGKIPSVEPPETLSPLDIPIPNDGVLYDYFYSCTGRGSWKNLSEVVKNNTIEEITNIENIFVPTLDTARYMHLVDMFISHRKPLLFFGPTGTGKTLYIRNYIMNKLSLDKYVPSVVTFTTQTSANFTQEIILSKLIKRKRGVYGPPLGKVCVIFIDDMNMPVKEKYGAQPPIELLRQFIDHNHWYDTKNTTKVYLKDILLLSAIGPTGGNRHDVCARFLRHFGLFALNSFDDESITKIFSNLLQIGLKRNGFTLEVVPIIDNIIQSTIDLYRSVINNLAPTPAKSHYLFNLRDISKVTNGILLFRKDSYSNRKVFVRLWVHEIMRVFCDRLIDENDKEWLFNKIRSNVNIYFQETFDIVFNNLSDSTPILCQNMGNLLYTNVIAFDDSNEKKYEEPPSISNLEEKAQIIIDEYNMKHKSKLNIVLFKYALEHLSRICRILTIPGGSALLIGVGGSGRQSLTRLAAAMYNYNVFQPKIIKGYGLNEWRNDLKMILIESGGKNRQTVFLFSERQIKEEYFLQDIDILLNSGEIPNLFNLDEQQNILEMVRFAAQGGNRNLDIAPLIVFNYFINRCKQNLHICLCFSPIGSTFKNLLRLYPSMVNCCTVDWFRDWPDDALEMIAHKYLNDVNLSEKIKSSAVTVCKQFHFDAKKLSLEFYSTTRRHTYITSASYLDLIQAYTKCTNRKQKDIMEAKMRYIGGLQELDYATLQVSQMKEDLFKLQPQLQQAQKDTEEMMTMISRETVEVGKATARVQEDEKVANVQAEAANELKTECEADLALAIPVLEDAIDALNTLKPTDITLVKSMKNPPEMVKTVMAAVCVMKGVSPDKIPDPNKPGQKILDFWGPSKRILGDINFLQRLKEYDKDNIPSQIMTIIRKTYLPDTNFKPPIVAKASSAAEGLCKWIIALDMYDKVIKVVAPKKEKLEIANSEYEATMAVLEEKRNEVRQLQERLDSLKDRLEETVLNKEKLLAEVALCQSKLIKAEKLIGSLGGEKNRWVQCAEELQIKYDCIPGDILISCGIIAYLAPFTSHFRSLIIDKWKLLCSDLNIPSSNSYSLIDVLGVPVKIQNWIINGLPMDSFSIDNAIIMDGSQRWSLLIDPQGQAHEWIKTMEKSNDIIIVKLTNSNYMKSIEAGIELGKPVLIENVSEDLHTPLDPVLLKQTYNEGNTVFITLGNKVIEYNSKFRLYITSKFRNPHYLPEIFNKVTIINFALTVEGLEEQLLGIVVAKERPDLESKRQQLILEGTENAKALLDVENNILQILSAPGNILEDENAVDVLDNSKILAKEITQKQSASVETIAVIDEFRLQYKPIAKHCSILYYCITDLPNLDPMYQYSLTWFIDIFIVAIETANKSKTISIRLEALKKTFTYNLYTNVCRSLFEKDKILFSFIICTTLMLADNKINKEELMFLRTDGVDVKNTFPNPGPDWLLDKSWNEICRLDQLNAYNGIKDDLIKNVEYWKNYYYLTDGENHKFPNPWHDKLSNFQRILVVRTIRPDKVIPVIAKFIEAELGEQFIYNLPFEIQKSYGDSTCLSPLIFILSPGVDPMVSLLQFAHKLGKTETLRNVSLGQGQHKNDDILFKGPIAELLIRDAQKTGGWVCLQNCHLAITWMEQLEAICDGFDDFNVNSEFRLWLTSYSSDKFPVSVLQNGVKMTNELPTGLQANMLRNYQSYPVKDQNFFEGCPGKEHIFTKQLYGLTFFHAVVQERRRFGPIGWNIPYGFNESDYHISIQELQFYINEFNEIPFEAVKYLTGECNYGGRITDDWDRRTLNTILNIFCCPQIVENPYYLFCDLSEKYGIPYRSNYQDFIKKIEEIPVASNPEVFGLHMNSGITRDLQATSQFFNSFTSVVESCSNNTDYIDTMDNLLMVIASDILAKLPDDFDIETAMTKYPVMYADSMNTVLIQEMDRFNVLLSVIRKSLHDLIKSIKGAIVMTPELETMALSLSAAKYPVFWSKFSYPSLKSLSGYISNFIERLNFLQVWYDKGKPNNFWLSGFFFPQAFLTGAMQNFSRRHTIPIDQLCYDFKVQYTDRIDASPEDGVYCYGLFLDGARWDRSAMVLAEQFPKVLTDVLPLVWFIPIRKNELIKGNRYTCPVYKTSERRGILSTAGHSTNYVLPMFLDNNKNPCHWIYRGVALLCQLND